jgi:hypothetical protein
MSKVGKAYLEYTHRAWKDGGLLPGTQGIGAQPAPECSTTDLGDYALGSYLWLDIGQRQSGERQSEAMRKLTGQGLYLHDDAGGKRARDARREVVRRGRADGLRRIVCATC